MAWHLSVALFELDQKSEVSDQTDEYLQEKSIIIYDIERATKEYVGSCAWW